MIDITTIIINRNVIKEEEEKKNGRTFCGGRKGGASGCTCVDAACSLVYDVNQKKKLKNNKIRRLWRAREAYFIVSQEEGKKKEKAIQI